METDHRQRAKEPEDMLGLRGEKDTVRMCVCVCVKETNREVCVCVYQYVIVIEARVCVCVRAQSNIMAHLTPS